MPSRDPPAPTRPVTMADVAARVGVSKMTVSRALNRSSGSSRSTSEALRQRIVAACSEMGYVIDQTARTFSSKRSGFVAVLVPTLNNSNFSETLHGLTATVEAAGLQLLLGYTDYSIEAEERLIKTMLMRRPEGLVLTGGSHTPAARAMVLASRIPVVETWDLPAEPLAHAVGFSNADAVAAMVRHLHARGRRRIAFVGGVAGRDARGDDRRRGYSRAIAELGLPEGRVFSLGRAPVPMAQGIEAVALVVQQWPEVDAIVFVSDPPAFGALMECQRRGWAVPGRIAIAGFGDFEVAKACHPRLSTVGVDCESIGRLAGEVLLRAIGAAREATPLPPETVLIPYHVEVREST